MSEARKSSPEGGSEEQPSGLEFLHDVRMRVSVEFGRSQMNIKQLLNLDKGALIELNKISGEPLDIRLNSKLVARGEAVIVNDRFGIRVTEIISPEDAEGGVPK